MGRAYEVQSGRVVNAGALTAITVNTGDSRTVKHFPETSAAYLEAVFARSVAAQPLRVRSSKMHDPVQGLRFNTEAATVRNFLGYSLFAPLSPIDELTIEVGSGGADASVVAWCTYYEDLPGIDARLAHWSQVQPLIKNLLTVQVTVAAAATLGDWSAGDTITNFADLLRANTDYAVLGYVSEEDVAAIGIRGPDTGNLRVGGPGTSEILETRTWFIDQSLNQGTPHIPVLNAANKGSTQVFQVSNVAGAQNDVQLLMAELGAPV